MAFDEAKDRILASQAAITSEKTRILVEIASYNGGEKKLQLKRETKTSTGWTFAKLGRMTGEEFMAVVPVGIELLERNGMTGGGQ